MNPPRDSNDSKPVSWSRVFFDWGTLVGLVVGAYWFGTRLSELKASITAIGQQVSTRGGPAISYESEKRLTILEERQASVLRRIDNLDMRATVLDMRVDELSMWVMPPMQPPTRMNGAKK